MTRNYLNGFIVVVALIGAAIASLLAGCDQSQPETATSAQPATATEAVSAAVSTSTVPQSTVPQPTAPQVAATYVGAATCGECHLQALQQWQQSHHDLAMQPARADTVLGNFDNARFKYNGITSTFSRQGDQFQVRTDGADGKLQNFQIAFTFGVYPLQQYLIAFDDGRLQALGIAWDSRPAAEGGQRWYHLYPDQQVKAGHQLHWTAPDQNWNHMCAECHSTNLHKGYDQDSDRFNTTYSEVNVACEACHGPGSSHVAWARESTDPSANQSADQRTLDNGLSVHFDERHGMQWNANPTTGLPQRSTPRVSSKEINTCARCHSRRGVLSEDFHPGAPIGDTHRLSLLTPDLYHPDGQPADENYVYGSFLQSRMQQAGVTCSDCHNPHSLQLKLPGDQVCSQCHANDRYNTPEHHFHQADSAGASCVSCHMPEQTFMGVDVRHDHSFRMPRPDQTDALGTPNTCNQCHQDKSPAWAAEQIKQHYPQPASGLQSYGPLLQRARQGDPAVTAELITLAGNQQIPGIARASAVSLLAILPGQNALQTIVAATHNSDPLVRRAAAEALAQADPALRVKALVPLLQDPVLDVRISAASALAALDPEQAFTPAQRQQQQQALQEYIDSLQLNADRAESWFNLGILYTKQGKGEAAMEAYRTALQKDAEFTPAAVNLANLYESLQSPAAALDFLRQQLQRTPDSAPLQQALALALVRQKDYPGARAALQRAVTLAPDDARSTYILAVLEFQFDNSDSGFQLLEDNAERHPFDFNTLQALVSYAQQYNRLDIFQRYAGRFRAFAPQQPPAQ